MSLKVVEKFAAVVEKLHVRTSAQRTTPMVLSAKNFLFCTFYQQHATCNKELQ